MVVSIFKKLIFGCVLLSCGMATAQDGSIRIYTPSSEIIKDRPFWLIVEAIGETVDAPIIEQGEAVVISTTEPKTQRSISIAGGRRVQTVKSTYYTIAIEDGTVTVPPVKARINGKILSSEALELTVLPPPAGTKPAPIPVRAWVSENQVEVGKAFWIYVEASGAEIRLPEMIEVEGVVIDPRNSQRSSSFTFGREGQRTRVKRGFYAVPTREGSITIPEINVQVNGRMVKTDSITIASSKAAIAPSAPGAVVGMTEQLTQDDLVFIEMDTDKREAYQGEAIYLTLQLWRIKYNHIQSGPYRGSLIINPTTEGFYVHSLEPDSFEGTRKAWKYEVTETRKLLYATRSGDLKVGQWHWEGIALLNRQSIVMKEKRYYKLDAGPIDLKVKELPRGPGGFSGAVGQFDVSAELDTDETTQGVPAKFTITVRGSGNPDAIGSPTLPRLDWAHISEPDQDHRLFVPRGEKIPQMAKYFTYTLTPLVAGRVTVPRFDFVYFDPEVEQYVRKGIGPFQFDVLASTEAPQHLVVAPDVDIAQRGVDILAEDIQPLIARGGEISASRPTPLTVPALTVVPVFAYLALTLFVGRRKHLAANVGITRAQRAKTKGLKRLRGVAESQEPVDELYRTMTLFIADKLNLSSSGLTSGDVKKELQVRGVDSELSDKTLRILKACERSRYASQELSQDEIQALISGAEACMGELNRTLGGKS